jgi:hypothetical protein
LKLGQNPVKSKYLQAILERLDSEGAERLTSFIGANIVKFLRDTSLDNELGEALTTKLLAAAEAAKMVESRAKQSLIDDQLADVKYNDQMEKPLSQQFLIINSKSRRQSFLYEPDGDIKHDFSYENIMMRLDLLLGKKGAEAWQRTNSRDCTLIYEPHEQKIFKVGHIEFFNTWDPAPWAKDWKPYKNGKSPEAPELFKTLLSFLTGNEEDAWCLQAWLRDMTFTRADPILVLCGDPGIGKNIFVDLVGKALVGDGNTKGATRGFSRSQFHSTVTLCRLFFLDETKLTESAKETLKTYHNRSVTVERKFENVGDSEKMHASFVLANNKRESIEFDFADRKFYAPDLGTVSIHEALGPEKDHEFYTAMAAACQDHEFLRELASYLYYTFPEGSSRRFRKKTATFKDICFQSMPKWLRNLKRNYDDRKLGGKSVYIPSIDALRGIRDKPIADDAAKTIKQYVKDTGDNFAEVKSYADGSWGIVFNPGSKEESSGQSGEELHI